MKMISKPVVSVVMPVYNGANYLREAIDSVLSQTYPHIEILVINDGSTDNGKTEAIAKSYGEKIRYFYKENGGVASALNLGIKNMRGTWFTWLSHDDLWVPDKIERQIRFFNANPNKKAGYTDFFIIDKKGTIINAINTPWYPRHIAIRKLFRSGYINGNSVMIEKTCFDNAGLFKDHLRSTQDTEMWIRLSRHYELARIPEKLMKERWHNLQGCRNIPSERHVSEMVAMYQQSFLSFDIDELFPEYKDLEPCKKKAKAYIWFGDTRSYFRGQFDFAAIQYKKAVEIDPSVKYTVRIRLLRNNILQFFSDILKRKNISNS
jgi:glycosyltransferase involved in cell wall biosynthesis